MPADNSDEMTTSEESLLLARLNRIENAAAGYFAVHLHLSELRGNNKQPHFLNIASRTFDNLLESNDATLFPMNNADMVLVCRNISVDDVDATIEKVRGLFSEDSLASSEEGDFEDRFATWYDLSNGEDFAAFFATVTDLAVETERKLEELAKQRGAEKMAGEPLSPSNLTAINGKLQAMRVADLIRRQTCLKVSPGGGGALVFRELFISMGEVRDRIAEGINLFASPWLFQYLSETLDKRLISVILEEDYENMPDAISINLNISTVLSKDFQSLHRAVGEYTNKVVVELQLIDILADMRNFAYARDSLQERGYKVVVDGLSPLSIEFFEPAMLKSDFLKVAWGPEFLGDDSGRRDKEMRLVVTRAGKDSMILARVDSEAAVKWGLNLGVSRFQGFFIDKLVQVMSGGKHK